MAKGDLTGKITIDAKGEILDLKNTINTMVDQLSTFAGEVTRVAREVGTEGKLGGKALVAGASGTWKDLTDNVNNMADNLTDQVRRISAVVKAVANGDLAKTLTLPARGEIADLVETINIMTGTLQTFAAQVSQVAREVGVEGMLGGQAHVPGALGDWKELTENVNQLAANLTLQMRAIGEVAKAVAGGNLDRTITVEARGEVENLKDDVNTMISNLRYAEHANRQQDWLKTNLARFSQLFQGQRDVRKVTTRILSELAKALSVQHGAFYLKDATGDEDMFMLISGYAFKDRKQLSNRIRPGEGLLGQCILEKERIVVREVPADYVTISSGLGKAAPLNIVVVPVLFEGNITAVIELAGFTPFDEIQLSFLDQFAENAGVMLNAIDASTKTENLLSESQSMTEELRAQQEELQEANKAIGAKAAEVEEQKHQVEARNKQIEAARKGIEEKAAQLDSASKYKSEFLTNMSHELRTPLNSLLILAQLLGENSEGNLTEKQVEYAETIHASGAELLSLINDVLDISKIEAGAATVETDIVRLSVLGEDLKRNFEPMAREKNLRFDARVGDDIPGTIYTDEKRLRQILKNMIGNAIKFTEKGDVSIEVQKAESGWDTDHEGLSSADHVISFLVTDTGIGIPDEKRDTIFEAFHQADGSISRDFGGTGLGLGISREIARLLKGQLMLLESVPGQGSTFALYLPHSIRAESPAVEDDRAVQEISPPKPEAGHSAQSSVQTTAGQTGIPDDRHQIRPGEDMVLLVVEDDPAFVKVLTDLAHSEGFKIAATPNGEECMALAKEYAPEGIILDIRLPGMNGWAVLDLIKHDSKIRHIPVHIIAGEENTRRGLSQGAFSVRTKPVTADDIKKVLKSIIEFKDRKKRLLVIEDNDIERKNILELVSADDIEITEAATGKDALEKIKKRLFDCIVLDLGLPDIKGVELLEKLRKNIPRETAIIIHTMKDLGEKEVRQLEKMSEAIVMKNALTPERLLDETTLFLHRIASDLPESKQKMLMKTEKVEAVLVDKKILIVDDDMRNIYVITDLLEQRGAKVLYATNGKEGVDRLSENQDVDLVLMDIMMPVMDGFEAMRLIRDDKAFKSLPIIAITAKAMKGDREECIKAGASDYISKPFDKDQLLSLLRVWLY